MLALLICGIIFSISFSSVKFLYLRATGFSVSILLYISYISCYYGKNLHHLVCLMDNSRIQRTFKIINFPDSSDGKESTCSAAEPSLIPGLGRSTGEGIGYPLQYSWASLVAQLVKESVCNEGDLGWEDPLEKGKATHSSLLAWRIP